jgi:glutamate-5-semialdehyde dehydrogenase
MDIMTLAQQAQKAKYRVSQLSSAEKNQALTAIADALLNHTMEIIAANQIDLANGYEKGLADSLLDRLTLDEKRIAASAEGVRQVVALEDPVGEVTSMKARPNGLKIGSKRVPLGVIGIIYEARPNVTVDAAVLCLKAGNAVILRGGKEAIETNLCLCNIMREALAQVGVPEDAIQLVSDTTRDSANQMMKLNGWIDVLIPRGGAGLIRSVVENATVPVIQTGVGNCHIYVDQSADLNMALNILLNAKCSRVSVCNAAESLLVHAAIAETFLPLAKKALDEKNVHLFGCPRTCEILRHELDSATEEDYGREYLDYAMSVKVVDSLDEAIAHINQYSTGHSEAIVTSDYFASQKFLDQVDSAAVYVNASTRFTDGFEFGFGAEIGISTQKLHARGPMGLTALTTNKYIIYGEGQVR